MRLLQRGILRRPSRGQPAQLDVDVSAAARGPVLTGHADGRTLSAQADRVILVQEPVPVGEIMAVTASEARKNLFPLIEQVNEDRTPIEITSRRGDAVLMSRADYDALEETAHLLRVPANARHLLESLQQARSGQRDEHDMVR